MAHVVIAEEDRWLNGFPLLFPRRSAWGQALFWVPASGMAGAGSGVLRRAVAMLVQASGLERKW